MASIPINLKLLRSTSMKRNLILMAVTVGVFLSAFAFSGTTTQSKKDACNTGMDASHFCCE